MACSAALTSAIATGIWAIPFVAAKSPTGLALAREISHPFSIASALNDLVMLGISSGESPTPR